jgi:hypothetical protein
MGGTETMKRQKKKTNKQNQQFEIAQELSPQQKLQNKQNMKQQPNKEPQF